MEVIDLFPKTITGGFLQNLKKDKASEIISYLNKKEIDEKGLNGGLTKDEQLLDDLIFAEIKMEILRKVEDFTKNCFGHVYDYLKIANSWANTVSHSEGIPIHRHVNSYISGVFYVTEGSPITFYDIGDNMFSILPECLDASKFPRSQSTFTIQPEPGLLVLFPSGLYHMVNQSHEDIVRYSIAFNIIPVGKIGSQTNIINFS